MTNRPTMDDLGYFPCRLLWSIKYNCPVFVVNQSKYGESMQNKTYILKNNKLEEFTEEQ